MELKAYLSYQRLQMPLSYWRSATGDYEVDFCIGDDIAIEVKTTDRVTDKHLKGLLALKEEGVFKKYYLLSFDKTHRISQGIEILHWQDFLMNLREMIRPLA